MRDDVERERNRRVLGEHYYGGGCGNRKGVEEGGEGKGSEVEGKGSEVEGKGKGRGEKIRVYASPDLMVEGGRGGGGR